MGEFSSSVLDVILDTSSILGTNVTVPVATGVANTDTANVMAAITKAGVGGVVYFPSIPSSVISGSVIGYQINASLIPLTGQFWWGPGALQMAAAFSGPLIGSTSVTAANNVTIFNMTLDGGSANGATNSANGVVYAYNMSRWVVTYCTIQNAGALCPAVNFRVHSNCEVSHCYIDGAGYGIIYGALYTDSTACVNNIIDDIVINTTTHDGIFVTENQGSHAGATVNYYVRNTVISNITAEGVGDVVVELGSGNIGATVTNVSSYNQVNSVVAIRDVHHSSVSNISCSGGPLGSCLQVLNFNILNGTIHDIALSNISGVSGSGNGAAGTSNNYGIIVTSSCTASNFYNITIDSLTLEGFGAAGIEFSGGVSNFKLNTFDITGCGSQGIIINGACTKIRIENGAIHSNGAHTTADGLYTGGVMTGLEIINVSTGNDGSGSGQRYGIFIGVRGSTGIKIRNCDLTGNVTGPVNFVSSLWPSTTIAQTTAITNVATSVAVGSTTNWPTTGTFVHGQYVIAYTSIVDGTHFGGCTISSGPSLTTTGTLVSGAPIIMGWPNVSVVDCQGYNGYGGTADTLSSSPTLTASAMNVLSTNVGWGKAVCYITGVTGATATVYKVNAIAGATSAVTIPTNNVGTAGNVTTIPLDPGEMICITTGATVPTVELVAA